MHTDVYIINNEVAENSNALICAHGIDRMWK